MINVKLGVTYTTLLRKPKLVHLQGENGATDLKLGMLTQLDSVNNMWWVPAGHTSSSVCKAKVSEMVFLKITL